jgi:hypothetical protein
MAEYDTVNELWYGVVAECINNKKCLRLHNGSVTNGNEAASFWTYLNEVFEPTDFYSLDHNYLIVNDCGTMLSVENIEYDIETIQHCNQYGLTIYLYENVILDNEKSIFVTTSSGDPAYKFPTRVLDNNIHCLDLNSVEIFVKNNNLTNVKVCLGDYGTKRLFQHRYNFEIDDTTNIFLLSLLGNSKDMYGITDYTAQFNPDAITKKFWSGNWRYALHRKIIASKLSNLNSNITWAFTDLLVEIDIDNPHYNSLMEGNRHLISTVPRTVDINFGSVNSSDDNVPVVAQDGFCPSFTQLPVDSYAECFLSVVTESEFYRPTACISDKIFNTIKCGRPFLLVSSPHSLEYLQKLGFKTFDKWWNECYSNTVNHDIRMNKILDIINYIDSLSIQECRHMYKEMLPVIQHNFENLYRMRKFHGSTII